MLSVAFIVALSALISSNIVKTMASLAEIEIKYSIAHKSYKMLPLVNCCFCLLSLNCCLGTLLQHVSVNGHKIHMFLHYYQYITIYSLYRK